ncbi:MAG TPA: hypothetical protein VIO38_05285 [Rariglobus sp.]
MPASVPMDIARPASRLPRRRHGGFALLITITLLAFLVLLLVSLASLTRVETQVASNNQSIAQARQNALLALNLALGQLQKHAGPDQRVTARADVQPLATTATPSPYPSTDPASGVNLGGATTTVLGGIDSYWRASRNRQWTGVWRNRNTPDYPQTPAAAAYDPDAPANFNPVPALQSWLVSGNESIADKFKPTGAVSGLTAASTALDKILDASGAPHRLLVKASAGVAAAADLDRAVTAPEMEIRSTAAPGSGGTDTVVGHYAWWVGDEGVKARANLVDPYAAAGTDEANRTRLQSAQRPAIEAMTANGTDGLAGTYPANNDDLVNVFTPAQLGYLNPAPTFPSEIKARFHDLSVSSRGILADAKHGGLKHDLSYLLSRPNLNDFRIALRTAYGTNDVAPSATANPALNSTGTPYATLPDDGNPSGSSWSTTPGSQTLDYGPTWEQLWSFHNMGNPAAASPAGVFDISGQAAPRRHTETQHGLYPLIIQAKVYYRLRIVGGAPDADGVNRTGKIWVDTFPLAVLANPYAVTLAPADYTLSISGGVPNLVFGSTDNTATPTTDFVKAYSTEPVYMGNTQLILRSPPIKPGEALIFTIDPRISANPTIANDLITVAAGNPVRQVIMTNDYDPSPGLTFNTDKTIPATATRVAMYSGAPQINTRLYMDYLAADGDKRLIQFIRGQQYTGDLGLVSGENRYLVVNPMFDGIRQGGGGNVVLNQPPTSTTVASLVPQQAPFYQVNYRTMVVFWDGNSTPSHPIEWARTFGKSGALGGSGTAGSPPPQHPFFDANLMRPSGSTTTVRWGLVNLGDPTNPTVPPSYITGDVGFQNLLYDLPRSANPLTSLGQLQHFNTAGIMPVTSFTTVQYQTMAQGFQVNYPLSNSYVHPRVPREQVYFYHNARGYHYDGSYLWNDLLWDRFYFSGYPQTGSFDFSSDKLINARFRPFRDRAAVAWDDESSFRGDGNPATAANSRAAAQNLLVDGAFNINSTSVEAWKAVFSSLKNVPVGSETAPSAPFARTLHQTGGSTDSKAGNTVNAWTGFVNLTQAQIQSLAEEMVMQVRKRGPFLSLADFINRRLIVGRSTVSGPTSDPLELGLRGALQAAIDRVINQKNDVAAPFNVTAKTFTSPTTTNGSGSNTLQEVDYTMSTGLGGFPGYLLQGDVLSSLGPTLAARSDTFTIRTYGDTTNPVTREVIGRAWCEAVVQRIPDYVVPSAVAGGNAPHEIPAAGSDNEKFGRRFQFVSFRWLGPDDI